MLAKRVKPEDIPTNEGGHALVLGSPQESGIFMNHWGPWEPGVGYFDFSGESMNFVEIDQDGNPVE